MITALGRAWTGPATAISSWLSPGRNGTLPPNGQSALVRSSDGGLTWSQPEVIRDTPLDDRPLGFTALGDGRVIAHVWSKSPQTVSNELLGLAQWVDASMLQRWLVHLDGTDARRAASRGAGCSIRAASVVTKRRGHACRQP